MTSFILFEFSALIRPLSYGGELGHPGLKFFQFKKISWHSLYTDISMLLWHQPSGTELHLSVLSLW